MRSVWLGISVAAAAAALGSGCDDSTSKPSGSGGGDGGQGGQGGLCPAEVIAKVEAFNGAVNELHTVTSEVKAEVAVACANIAIDLGETPPDVGDGSSVSDDDLQTACSLAAAAIEAEIQANGEIATAVIGGKCEVNASAQFNCEAECSVDGSCDPGTIEARCEPGELSGECSAECTGSCTVESGSAACSGSCSGTCSGDCSGTCAATGTSGACNGYCEGTCTGDCAGTCEVIPPSATCPGSCKGGCTVEITGPACEDSLSPPSCTLDAECGGACAALGNLGADCTPPQIIIEGNANLVATLEANLPAPHLVLEVQGELLLDSSLYVAETAVGVLEAAVAVPACAATFGGDLMGSFVSAIDDSVSVSVLVSASAEVVGPTY